MWNRKGFTCEGEADHEKEENQQEGVHVLKHFDQQSDEGGGLFKASCKVEDSYPGEEKEAG